MLLKMIPFNIIFHYSIQHVFRLKTSILSKVFFREKNYNNLILRPQTFSFLIGITDENDYIDLTIR